MVTERTLFKFFLCTIHSGIWKDTIHYVEINELLDTLLPRSGYIVCPGIQDYEANMEPLILFHSIPSIFVFGTTELRLYYLSPVVQACTSKER